MRTDEDLVHARLIRLGDPSRKEGKTEQIWMITPKDPEVNLVPDQGDRHVGMIEEQPRPS